MFDNSKLKGRIVEKFGTQGAFATAVGRSSAYVSEVLTGKAYLEQRDIEKWASTLGIESSEIHIYFFTKKVHETEQ